MVAGSMNEDVPPLCRCGCGLPTNRATQTRASKGIKKGEFVSLVKGHGRLVGQRKRRLQAGYERLLAHGHPRADPRGYVLAHILVVEQAMQKELPVGREVHHINGVRDDNRPENLVVCEDQLYHCLLHTRQRALEKCGHADWVRCHATGSYYPKSEMKRYPSAKYDSAAYYHPQPRLDP